MQRVFFPVIVALCAESLLLVKASQKEIPESAAGQIRALIAEKATRNPAQLKLDSRIHYAAKIKCGEPVANGISDLPAGVPTLRRRTTGRKSVAYAL